MRQEREPADRTSARDCGLPRVIFKLLWRSNSAMSRSMRPCYAAMAMLRQGFFSACLTGSQHSSGILGPWIGPVWAMSSKAERSSSSSAQRRRRPSRPAPRSLFRPEQRRPALAATDGCLSWVLQAAYSAGGPLACTTLKLSAVCCNAFRWLQNAPTALGPSTRTRCIHFCPDCSFAGGWGQHFERQRACLHQILLNAIAPT